MAYSANAKSIASPPASATKGGAPIEIWSARAPNIRARSNRVAPIEERIDITAPAGKREPHKKAWVARALRNA